MSYQLTVGAGVNRRPSMLCLTLAISVHTLGSPYTQPSLGLEQIIKACGSCDKLIAQRH